MSLNLREIGDVTVIDLPQRITIAGESELLLETIRDCVGQGRNKILLNLKDVSYIDSAGLGAIIAAVIEVMCARCDTRFCKGTDRVCPKCQTDPSHLMPRAVLTPGVSKPPWGELKLASVPQKIRALLQITKLEGMFESFEDEAAAIRGFQGEAP
jgi:anti-sigma B factor antagonist